MSAFFVYHTRTRPTGRLLARALGIESGYASRARRQISDGDVLIRWGTQEAIHAHITTINPTGALALASDKLRALSRFEEEGVPHPEFVIENMAPDGVWMGRKRHGFGGRDITVYENQTVLVDGPVPEFYTKFIPNEREYRIHVYNGEVIRVQRKYLDHPEQRRSEYIKNYQNGYRFRQPTRRLNTSRLEAATKAVAALGLTFGAVDLIVDHEGREYVLEVNTAPKCSPLTAGHYVDAITAHLRELGVEVTPNLDVLEALSGPSD